MSSTSSWAPIMVVLLPSPDRRNHLQVPLFQVHRLLRSQGKEPENNYDDIDVVVTLSTKSLTHETVTVTG